ncbi:RNHCP domain-containing protein [Heyndrickxia sporothermodurans]
MSRKKENQGFICENCGETILPLTNGSYRNHCPFCLHSKHVDRQCGDRLNDCHGLMEPIEIIYSSKKGYMIIHRCLKCQDIKRNKAAADTIQPDHLLQLIK